LHLKYEAALYRAKWGHRLRIWQKFLANLWTQNFLKDFSVLCRSYSGPRWHCLLLSLHSCHKP
jgi:hypothetical protein